MDDIRSLFVNEDGSIKYTQERQLDPFVLEDIRESFARFDKHLDSQGLHMERVAISGFTSTAWSGPPPYPIRHMEDFLSSWGHCTPPSTVCISVVMEEGQELTKEQILIIDHFAGKCSAALLDFYHDGSLPDSSKIKGPKEQKQE
jgi:hypothetical protein